MVSMETTESNGQHVELTEHEAELYDRQIRLWGLESQKRLRAAKICIIGLSGFGAEIAKNIILSGVNAVTFLDNKILSREDSCAQFLAPTTEVGKNRATASLARARALNPMVEITADNESVDKKDSTFFKEFDVVVATGLKKSQLIKVNGFCREHNVKFFAGDVWGMIGYTFADLNEHEFIEDVVKHKTISDPGQKVKTEMVTTQTKRNLTFSPINGVFDVKNDHSAFKKNIKRVGPGIYVLSILHVFRERHNRNPCYSNRMEDLILLDLIRQDLDIEESILPQSKFQHVFSQISPAAAIVGGVLAQEVIKTVSQKEAPIDNLFIFDPETCRGYIETIKEQ